MTWRDDMALLREPGVGLLFAGRTLNMLGMAFAPVALAFGVLHLPHGDAKLLSVVLAAEAIPLIVFLLLGGVVADRLPRHLVLGASQLLATLAYAALAVMLAHNVSSPWLLGTAATLSGVGGALGWPAIAGLIPQVVPPEKLQTGNALLGMGASLARIAGLVAGGAVTALVGGAAGVALSALMFAATAVLALFLRPRLAGPDGEAEPRGSVLRDLAEGWREFVSREWLWVVVAQWALLIMCFTAAQSVLGPVLADERLGGAGPWSWILAAEGAGNLVGVVLAMRLVPRRPILVSVLATAVTVWVPFLMLAFDVPVPAVMAAMVALGAAFAFFGVLWTTTMQREVPPAALSRVSSYDAMGSMMFGPIGLLLAGPAAAAWGAARAMAVCAALLFGIGIAALASRDVRTLTWHEAPSAAAEPAIPAGAFPEPETLG